MFPATSSLAPFNGPVPPSPPSLPLLGNYFALKNDSLEFLRTAARDHGDVVRIEFLLQVFYLLSAPEHIEKILLTENASVMKDLGEQMLRKTFLGVGLLTAEADEHKQMRKMSSPAFSRGRITGYGEIMSQYAEEEISKWKNNEVRDIHADMSSLAQRIVARTLFDSRGSDDSLEIGQIMADLMPVIALRNFAEIWLRIPTGARQRVERSTQKLDQIIYGIIDEHLASAGDRGDLLSMLIAGKKADGVDVNSADERKRLRDEALTIYLAGFETTANAMTWTLHLLAGHPEKQKALFHELTEVLGGRAASSEDMSKLKYTRAVISESMRLYPPAWVIGRVLLKDLQFGKYTIPKGAEVWMSQYVMHRDPRYFSDPDSFIPERWLDENFQPSRFAYFPFSAGPRNCIGEHFAWLESTMVIANAVRRFEFQSIGEKVQMEPLVTLRPKGGLRLRVTERS
jgi:cytochrome P450